ncbi:MAG: L-lactate dehydrogenase [Ruminococcaceae bacterium]|nr:L-lactate dehydrogenase [Oscillospiraceae bacterium]
MRTNERKIGIVGCGQVGMSYAFSLIQNGICDKLVLIDIDRHRIEGEAADLSHSASFLGRTTEVFAGEYTDLSDADIVLIAAGANQKPGQDRMALLSKNTAIMEEVVLNIVHSGFQGIYLVVTNPVDIMAKLTLELSGAPHSRVIGSGTILDTGRLRYLLGNFFSVDPKNIHAYVLGEHGESEFVPWSQATVATKWVIDVCRQDPRRFPLTTLFETEAQTRNAAGEIIAAKGATYYGIALALCRLTDAILSNEQSIFTLSCYQNGEYGVKDVYIGVPAIVGKNGIREIVGLTLSEEEQSKFNRSAAYLDSMYHRLAPRFV